MSEKGRHRERELFQAAIALFREKGYQATSIRDIAEAVGIHKSALYHYVGSKEDLMFRISDGTLKESLSVLREILAMPVSSFEKLRRALEHHITYVATRGTATTVFLRDIHSLGPQYRDSILRSAREYTAMWEQILHKGIEAGELRPLDIKMTVLAILGMGNWVATWYKGNGRLTPGEISREFLDVLLIGVAAPNGRQGADHSVSEKKTMILTTTLPVRWGDLDATGSTPAPNLGRECERLADQWLESLGWPRTRLWTETGTALSVVRSVVDTHGTVRPDAPMETAAELHGVSERSVALTFTMSQGRRTMARVELVLEARDSRTGMSLPLPAGLREALAAVNGPAG